MTTAISMSNRLYAGDKGKGPTDESFSQENSYERKHRDMDWEMKRQAREKKVKELEQNLNQIKTQTKSRMDNPYYDNSYLTNVKAVQNKASDYLKEAYSQVGEIHTITYVNPYDTDVKSYKERGGRSPVPPDQGNNRISNQMHKHSLSANPIRNDPYSTDTYQGMPLDSTRKLEQRYHEDSPPERVDNYYQQQRPERDENKDFVMSPVLNKPAYKPSVDFATVFKEDLPKNNSMFRWDNNTRGQRLKQEYNMYVSQEMEKDRMTNPRLKRRSKERYEGDDSSSVETRRRLVYPDSVVGKSLPNLQLIQPQGKQQVFHSPVLRKSAKQEAYANDLLDQIKQKEQEKHQRRYQKMLDDRRAMEDAEIYFPFGKPGAGAPLVDEYGDVNAKRNRDASNAIHNTDAYSTYNNYHNMNASAMSSPGRPNYQGSQLAKYGNQILDRGNYEASTEYGSTIDSTDRRHMLNVSPTQGMPTDRVSQRRGDDLTHQVPGMGIGYNYRDQQLWQKKQRIADDLANTYKYQMAERKRREMEEKMRIHAEERAIEERVKRELKEMAMAYQAEKEANAHEQSRINKSFDKLKEELEIDNQGRRIRKKGPIINLKPSVVGSKRDLDSHEKAESALQSQHMSMRDQGNVPAADPEDNLGRSRILNESILDQQKTGEKPSNDNNKLAVVGDFKPSPFYHKQYRADYYPDGTEMPVSFKTAADERIYRMKKDLATRTSLLQEQSTQLKGEAINTETIKQDAVRELLRLKEQLKQEKGFEDYRAKEVYEYLSKSTVNNLSQKHDQLRNLDKPHDYPMRPRNYAKIFELNDDYEDYYARMKSQLDDVSQLVSLKDSHKIDTLLRAQPNPNKQNKSAEGEGQQQQATQSKGDLTNRTHQSQQDGAKMNGENGNSNPIANGTNSQQHQYQTNDPRTFGQQPTQYDQNGENQNGYYQNQQGDYQNNQSGGNQYGDQYYANNQGQASDQQQTNTVDTQNLAVLQGLGLTNTQYLQPQTDAEKSTKEPKKAAKDKKAKKK